MFDSVRPHRRQPTRLHHSWDSPGKNTGVGCHFLLQCMKVKSESEVTQSCPTLCDPMDCSLPGSSIHGIFQARVLEWGAIAFSLRVARSSKWKYKTPFTKNKCMYSIHGETKQTKTSEFGAKKSLLQGQERTSSLCSKNPQLLNGFQGVFIGKIWGGVT